VIQALDPEKYEAIPIGITRMAVAGRNRGAQNAPGHLRSGERVMLSADPNVAPLSPSAIRGQMRCAWT